MNVFARIEVFDNMLDTNELNKIRGAFKEVTGNWMNTGKLVYSGVFANRRGGIFILDVKDSEELFTLVAPIIDYVKIETEPLVSLETLGKYFQNNPV